MSNLSMIYLEKIEGKRIYTVTLPEITIDTINAYLEQLWQEYHANPQEMHMAVADYVEFGVSLLAHVRYDSYLNKWKEIDGIINLTTGQMVRLIKEVRQERGVILFHEQQQERVSDMQLVSYAELG